MLLDIVIKVIGELPTEFEFIYYIIACGAAIALLSLPLAPFLALFKNIGKRR